MKLRLILSVCLLAALAFAQGVTMSVNQLKGFVRSSIRLKHPDKQVADYLKNVKLNEKLTSQDVEELMNEGMGEKTTTAMSALVKATANFTTPVTDAPLKAAPPPPMPPPPTELQNKVISEAREIALGYAKRLPDFICLQMTYRYVDPSGLEYFQLADKIAARLSYFEQKENYKLISVNGGLTEGDFDKLGGATSRGEFGTMLKQIFEPATQAEFQWERWAKLRGKICHVYSYRVVQSRSNWSISYQKQLEIRPAYRGLIYVDRDVPMVVKVTMEAENMPASFPIQEARNTLDYDFIDIAGSQFLLPLKSEMRMREGKLLVKNSTEFRNYRKFGAEATITFDTNVEPLPEEKEKPPQQ
ncbi:MAG: hypothetical protein IPP47_17895 [Bryobacterales bacterium]|nr:hypothetical protein [Bryobacterales bacterium]